MFLNLKIDNLLLLFFSVKKILRQTLWYKKTMLDIVRILQFSS